jgi:hypothetical protein
MTLRDLSGQMMSGSCVEEVTGRPFTTERCVALRRLNLSMGWRRGASICLWGGADWLLAVILDA